MPSGSTVFKYGCFGCLGLIVLVASSLAVMVGVAKMQAGKVEVAEQAISPELPPSSFELPEPDVVTTESGPIQAAGRIELDLSGAEFNIEPAGQGKSLHVDAVYDKTTYVFEESLKISDDGPWVYRVTFHQSGSGLFTAIKEMFSKVKPKVTVYIPTDRPVALDLKLGKGGAEVDLGGLWITEADIDMQMGGMVLSVSEPMKAPMDRLVARVSMGGFVMSRLGNASPRILDVDARMGGMELDLRGQWITDSDVSIRFSMGGGAVRLPDGVRFEGLDRPGVALLEDQEIPPPTLKFDIQGNTEDLEIRYP
jgi:hypothetical protein